MKDKFLSKNWQRALLLVLLLFLLIISSYYFKIDIEKLKAFLERFSLWKAAVIYIFIFVLITIFVTFAKDILKAIGAICFGAVLSSFCIWIAEIINATLFFYLARHLGRGFVEERLKGRAKLLDEKISSSGFKGILILRLVPLIPYRMLDLLVGLTSLTFIQYFMIVAIASPLRIFWVQYILAGVGVGIFKNPSALVDYMMANKLVFAWSFVYLILVIVIGFRLKFKKKI